MLKFIVVILLLARADGSRRVVRKAGDQPSEGSCMEFKWGGDSTLHWYNCCNNCVNGRPVDRCDGITWQSASNTAYCGKCGTDTQRGDGTRRGTPFKCGGCSGQEGIREICIAVWKKIPGFCWAFSRCFHGKCEETYGFEKMSEITNQTPDTCYNSVCDAGETPDNCPIDCCYQKNPSCTWNNTCISSCCDEKGCCITSDGPRNLAQTEIILIVIALVLFV